MSKMRRNFTEEVKPTKKMKIEHPTIIQFESIIQHFEEALNENRTSEFFKYEKTDPEFFNYVHKRYSETNPKEKIQNVYLNIIELLSEQENNTRIKLEETHFLNSLFEHISPDNYMFWNISGKNDFDQNNFLSILKKKFENKSITEIEIEKIILILRNACVHVDRYKVTWHYRILMDHLNNDRFSKLVLKVLPFFERCYDSNDFDLIMKLFINNITIMNFDISNLISDLVYHFNYFELHVLFEIAFKNAENSNIAKVKENLYAINSSIIGALSKKDFRQEFGFNQLLCSKLITQGLKIASSQMTNEESVHLMIFKNLEEISQYVQEDYHIVDNYFKKILKCIQGNPPFEKYENWKYICAGLHAFQKCSPQLGFYWGKKKIEDVLDASFSILKNCHPIVEFFCIEGIRSIVASGKTKKKPIYGKLKKILFDLTNSNASRLCLQVLLDHFGDYKDSKEICFKFKFQNHFKCLELTRKSSHTFDLNFKFK
eukprot:gene2534-3496_t